MSGLLFIDSESCLSFSPNHSLNVALEIERAISLNRFLSVDTEGAEHMVFKNIAISHCGIKAVCIEQSQREID